MQIPLLKGDRVEGADYRDALLNNMVAVKRDIKGATGYIINHAGVTRYASTPGIDRGGHWNERLFEHFRLSGDSLITVSQSGFITNLGEIPSTTGLPQASWAHSFNTQAIVANGNYYLYDPNNGLRQITDAGVGSPIDFIWIDGYYFFTDGETLYHTDIDNEEVIDPLNFATSEFSPDPTLGLLKTQDNQVAVFNRYTTEWFINRGTTQFAFERIAGKAVKGGIIGTHCKCELGGNFFVLGGRKEESPSVHIIIPGNMQSVATREIDRVIAQYSEAQLSSVIMESRVEKRDMFVLVHLPNEVLLYNHTVAQSFGPEQAWTILTIGVNQEPWTCVNGVFDPRLSSSGGWVYGDKERMRLGYLNDDVSTFYEEKQEFIFYSPFIPIDKDSIDHLEMDTIPGFTDDKATVAFSRTENGLTYGKEQWFTYGTKQDYHQRFIARRLGYVRDFTGFKFRAVTDSRLAFSGLRINEGD